MIKVPRLLIPVCLSVLLLTACSNGEHNKATDESSTSQEMANAANGKYSFTIDGNKYVVSAIKALLNQGDDGNILSLAGSSSVDEHATHSISIIVSAQQTLVAGTYKIATLDNMHAGQDFSMLDYNAPNDEKNLKGGTANSGSVTITKLDLHAKPNTASGNFNVQVKNKEGRLITINGDFENINLKTTVVKPKQ